MIHGMSPSMGKKLFFSPEYPDWPLGSPSLPFNAYREQSSWGMQMTTHLHPKTKLPLIPLHAVMVCTRTTLPYYSYYIRFSLICKHDDDDDDDNASSLTETKQS